MESTEDNGVSLIITEDGQYNLVGTEQPGAGNVAGLSEATEVILQPGDAGIEVMYIVQPEEGGENVSYSDANSEGVRILDINGTLIQVPEADIVNTEEGNNGYLVAGDINSAVPVPDVATDSSINVPGTDIVEKPSYLSKIEANVGTKTNIPDEAGDRKTETMAEEEEDVNILLFCQYCGENLMTLDDLRTHLKDEHDVDDDMQSDDGGDVVTETLFPSCQTCRSTFLDEEDLKAHKKKCESEDCDELLENDQHVDLVVKEGYSSSEHKCQMCDRVFKVRSDLNIHIENGCHEPVFENHGMASGGVAGMYHKCPYCPRLYMSKWHKKSLIKHIKEEHPNELWDVPFELVEADKTKLFRRLNAKKGGYTNCFPCRFCSHKFLWQKSLNRHYKNFHQDRLDTLGEYETNELLGIKQNRSVTVIGDEGNFSCTKCGKQFIWEKSLRRHAFYCKAGGEDQSELGPYEHLLKCLYCSLVSKYTCSMRKHMKRFHSKELGDLDVNKIDIPIVDMETYGHSLISIDRRPADIRLKDCPVVFKCKFCEYASAGQSNLKRHLLSIKHNFTEEEIKKMKLSSFKVIQKRAPVSARRTKSKQKPVYETGLDGGSDNDNIDDDSKAVPQEMNNKIEGAINLENEKIKEGNNLVNGKVNEKMDGNIGNDGVEKSSHLEPEPYTPKKFGPAPKTNSVKELPGVRVLRRNLSDDQDGNVQKDSKSNDSQRSITDEERQPLSGPESFLCPICHKDFKEFPALVEHCQRYVNIKIEFTCSLCDNAFPIFESLKRHHREMHYSKEFKATRLNSISVKEVKYKQSQVKAFECPYCDLILSQSFALKQHVLEEHKKKVLTLSIKIEPTVTERLGEHVITGFECGFCECSYATIEDMVFHMQIIHPFVDKSTQGQGNSDSGSVRKSGRKRKLKYPGFDEEPPTVTSKKTKLDFKSPVPTKKISNKDVDLSHATVVVKDKVSSVTSSKISNRKQSSLSGDKTTTPPNKSLQEDKYCEKGQQEKKVDNQQVTLEVAKNLNFQPIVVLTNTAIVNSPEVTKLPKKRGRKRKEEKPKSADSKTKVPDIQKGSSSDLASKNKCPHCSFSCKRSSALAFHINFNHVKIKEEPPDSDADIHKNESQESTPKRKKNSFDSETNKIDSQYTKKDTKHVKILNNKSTIKTEENKIQQKTKKYKRKTELQKPDIEKSYPSDQFEAEEVYDEEDLDMLDDSDNDQDYKPVLGKDEEEDGEEESVNELEFAGNTPTKYKCIFCKDKKFTSARILERHMKRDHPEKIGSYSIEECEEVTERPVSDVPNTSPVDSLPNTSHEHKCMHCGNKYPTLEMVINHVKEAHQSIIAGKIKRTSVSSNVPVKPMVKAEITEIKSLTGKLKYKCSVCNFLCRTPKGLKKHMVRCHPESIEAGGFITELDMDPGNSVSNSYKCPHCRYKTYYKSSIKRHVRIVHPKLFSMFDADRACGIVAAEDRERERKEKVPQDAHFSCPYCGIINKWKKSIVRHIRVVHPEESFDVEIPPVSMSDLGEVKRYERLNIGYKKRLQCLHCSFSCKILSHMTKHIEKVHDLFGRVTNLDGQVAYQYVYEKQATGLIQDGVTDVGLGETDIHKCPYCGLSYGWKKSLLLHVKKFHPESLGVLETMDKMLMIVAKSAGRGKFRKYLGKKCDKCGLVFRDDVKLKKHLRIKHNIIKRPGVKYTLPRYVTPWHQRNYRFDGRYRVLNCKYCDKRLHSLLALKAHRRIYHHDQLLECLYVDCNAKFVWQTSREIHLEQVHHHSSTTVPGKAIQSRCEMCVKICGSPQQLRAHIAESHLCKKVKRRPFMFKCKACSHVFESAGSRDHHFSTAHIELTEMCDICGGVFPSKKQLEHHIKKHEKNPADSTIMCDYCGLTLVKKSIKKHLLFKHTEKLVCDCAVCCESTSSPDSSIRCDLCGRSFCQKLYLYAHKRLNHKCRDRLYNCKICKASFSSQKLRNIHLHEQHLHRKVPKTDNSDGLTMDVWTTEEDKDRTTHVIHVGQDKGAQYLPKLSESSLSAVIKELMIVSNDKNVSKPFKCLLCGRSFGKSKYIKLHIRRNHVKDEDKPYRCKVCGSGFVRLTEFRKHSRSHSGFRPYKCKICNKAFKQQANLIDHMHIHKDSKDFQCFICKRHFQQRGGMTSHILTHDTLKPFKCMFCERGFTSRGELSRHMQKYSSQMEDSKTFLCHICQTSFPHYPLLLRHIETHNPEKPFTCEACGTKFGSYISLYNHKMKMQHFLLTEIQLDENMKEDAAEKTGNDTQAAVAALEIDLYQGQALQQSTQGEEATIYITHDGYVDTETEMAKTTIYIEPEAEEIVQTSDKLHENEELLSIAKQLTELSTYTENESTVEFSVLHDEHEIMKDMLDADTEVLANIDKQTIKQKQVSAGVSRRKVPETIEEILQIQHEGHQEQILQIQHEGHQEQILQIQHEGHQEQILQIQHEGHQEQILQIQQEEEQDHIAQIQHEEHQEHIAQIQHEEHQDHMFQIQHEEQQEQVETMETAEELEEVQENQVILKDEVILEEVAEEDTEVNQKPGLNETEATPQEMTSNMEELAALIAQNTAALQNTDSITAYEAEDGVIYVYMPENVDSNSYQEVLNSAVQSFANEHVENPGNIVENGEVNDMPQEATDEISKSEDIDVPVIHVNINQIPEGVKTEEAYMKVAVGTQSGHQSAAHILEQDTLNLYEQHESDVVEIENDEKTFIKQELLDASYGLANTKFTLENGEFTYHTIKLKYEISGKTFKCLECGKFSKTKKRLKDHLKRHIPMEKRENACIYCPKRFVTGNELIRHLTTHTDDRRYKCKHCSKSFRQPGHLNEHLLIHQNLRPHSCSRCKQTFRTKRHLIVHFERKHNSTKFQCDECKAILNSKTGLIIHKGSMHSSSLKRPTCGATKPTAVEGGEHQCCKCGNTFSTAGKLKKHMRSHDANPPNKNVMCDVCGMMYHSKEYLREHILLMHSDEAAEICDECGETFKTSRLLLLHKRKIHKKNLKHTQFVKKTHTCKVCQKRFSTRHALAYHVGATPACKNAIV